MWNRKGKDPRERNIREAGRPGDEESTKFGCEQSISRVSCSQVLVIFVFQGQIIIVIKIGRRLLMSFWFISSI